MESVWRQIPPRRLTDKQRSEKIKRDSQYEITAQNLTAAFYQRKRSVGVTRAEEATYKAQKKQLWEDYVTWAKGKGLWEEITPQELLAEAEDYLNDAVERVNVLKIEMGKKPIQIIERS